MNEYRIANRWVKKVTPKDKEFWTCKKAENVVLRNCIAFVLKDKTSLNEARIGTLINKNRTTIVNAIKYHKERVTSGKSCDEDYRICYEKLLKTFPKELKGDCFLYPNNGYWNFDFNLYNLLVING